MIEILHRYGQAWERVIHSLTHGAITPENIGTIFNILYVGIVFGFVLVAFGQWQQRKLWWLIVLSGVVYVVMYAIEPAPPSFNAFYPEIKDTYNIKDIIRNAASTTVLLTVLWEMRHGNSSR